MGFEKNEEKKFIFLNIILIYLFYYLILFLFLIGFFLFILLFKIYEKDLLLLNVIIINNIRDLKLMMIFIYY